MLEVGSACFLCFDYFKLIILYIIVIFIYNFHFRII